MSSAFPGKDRLIIQMIGKSILFAAAGFLMATAVACLGASASSTKTAAGIEIVGDSDFAAWTNEALQLIEERAPEAYTDVVESVRKIRSVDQGSGINVRTRVYRVGEVTAHAPGHEPRLQLLWYAGTIVHEACHRDRYEEGVAYSGKDAELACLAVQKQALIRLGGDTYMPGYIQDLIDGADDPANQYWNKASRHW